jgi:exodeoxyribonuclease V alpha subunit
MARTSTVSSTGVLAGLVERVTFHNEENGFCVLRVKARGQRDLITVLGHAAMISAGEFVQASGTRVNDRTHGVQFRASFLKAMAPNHDRGDREISRLRDDPRHWPDIREEARPRFRRGRL